MKTVHDIMDRTDKTLNAFFSLCDEMTKSKFILAEKTISELLQLIASSKKLYDIIDDCTKNYNFAKELMRACREENGSNWVEFSQMTPSERIAFTFCLLYSFDTHKIDLQTFINKHYSSDNINMEFALFCQTVIMQFKADIQARISGKPQGIIYKESIKAKESSAENEQDSLLTLDSVPEYFVNFSKSKELAPFDKGVNHRLVEDSRHESEFLNKEQYNYLVHVSTLIREKLGEIGTRLKREDASECAIVLEAFERSVMYGHLSLIKSTLVGLKNTLKCLAGHSKNFSEPIELLESF